MKIHNFYNDLLLSLSYFVNFVLNDEINFFQYNFGNPSFRLAYNSNYDFPGAVISYTSSQYYNIRPNSFQHPFTNLFQIYLVYNRTKDISIILQEDLMTINVDIQIFCDTQLQALNYKHNFESTVPLNKFLHAHKFCSFIEIDSLLINRFLFDVDHDRIENLILRHDYLTDKIEYFSEVSYKPLIKLTNSTIDFSDTITKPTLNLSFEILNHIPVKFLYNFNNNKINERDFLNFKNIKIPVNNKFKYLKLYLMDETIVNCLCNIQNNKITGFHNRIIIFECNITNKIINGVLNGIFNKIPIMDIEFRILNGKNDVLYGTIEHRHIYGKIKNIKIYNENIQCDFIDIVDNRKINFDFSGRLFNENLIDVKFENISIIVNKTNYEISNIYANIENIKHYELIEACNIFENIKPINIHQNEIDNDHSEIIGYNTINDNKISDFVIFDNKVKIIDNKFKFNIGDILVSGFINPLTSKISMDIPGNNINELLMNIQTIVFPIRGLGSVNKATIQFENIHHPISQISPIQMKYFDLTDTVLLVTNIEFFLTKTHCKFFVKSVHIQNEIKSFKMFFTKNNKLITERDIGLPFFENNKFVFNVTIGFYNIYIKYIDNKYPMYFTTKTK